MGNNTGSLANPNGGASSPNGKKRRNTTHAPSPNGKDGKSSKKKKSMIGKRKKSSHGKDEKPPSTRASRAATTTTVPSPRNGRTKSPKAVTTTTTTTTTSPSSKKKKSSTNVKKSSTPKKSGSAKAESPAAAKKRRKKSSEIPQKSKKKRSPPPRINKLKKQETLEKLHPSLLTDDFLATMKKLHGNFGFVADDCFVHDIRTKFKILRTLGKGASCEVYEAESRTTGQKVALKQLTLADEENSLRFKNEVEVLAKIKHQNIVKFHSAYVDEKNLYISLEFCKGGHLLHRIRQLHVFSEHAATQFIHELIRTIKFCHDKNIVHRDLKPLNVMFARDTPDSRLVIIDFGDAIEVETDSIYTDIFGTVLFLPPEFRKKRYGWEMKAGDMWSIGIIAYVLLTGTAPFMGTQRKVIEMIENHRRIKFPKDMVISDTAKSFILGLLTKNTKKRMTCDQALDHPWLRLEQSKAHLGDHLLDDIGDFYDANVLKKILVDALIRDMTREHKAILLKAFRELDTDNDGFIEEPEIEKWLESTGMDPGMARSHARSIMVTMDHDKEGKISFGQFIRAKTMSEFDSAAKEKNKGKVVESLKLSLGDAYHSNQVNVRQLKDHLQMEILDASQLKGALEMVDELETNDKGDVDVDAFLAAINRTESDIHAQIAADKAARREKRRRAKERAEAKKVKYQVAAKEYEKREAAKAAAAAKKKKKGHKGSASSKDGKLGSPGRGGGGGGTREHKTRSDDDGDVKENLALDMRFASADDADGRVVRHKKRGSRSSSGGRRRVSHFMTNAPFQVLRTTTPSRGKKLELSHTAITEPDTLDTIADDEERETFTHELPLELKTPQVRERAETLDSNDGMGSGFEMVDSEYDEGSQSDSLGGPTKSGGGGGDDEWSQTLSSVDK